MPITQADLPVRILDSLMSTGVRFLVLHDEEKVGSDALTSDVDIVLDSPISRALPLLRQALSGTGLLVGLVWPYDVGGGASVFFTDAEGKAGAQIDALYDLRGSGRYGLRSSRLFAGQRPGKRFPIPNRLDELLYAARKAAVKGKLSELNTVRRIISSEFAAEAVRRRVRELFSVSAANSLLVALRRGKAGWSFRPQRWLQSLVRVGMRITQPIGFWVHIIGPESENKARELRSRFEAWLVRVEIGNHRAGAGALLWWATDVVPVRLRPGLFLSYSEKSLESGKADLLLRSPQATAILAKSIVEAMARKAAR
jgi:hypothetical protein